MSDNECYIKFLENVWKKIFPALYSFYKLIQLCIILVLLLFRGNLRLICTIKFFFFLLKIQFERFCFCWFPIFNISFLLFNLLYFFFQYLLIIIKKTSSYMNYQKDYQIEQNYKIHQIIIANKLIKVLQSWKLWGTQIIIYKLKGLNHIITIWISQWR